MKIIIEAEALEVAEFIEKLQGQREKAMAATNACACGKCTEARHIGNKAAVHKGTYSF